VIADGRRRPTIYDVARAAGVSKTTVSHALSGHRPVDAATRARVAQAVSELGYAPSLRAQRLSTGRGQNLALIDTMPASVTGGVSLYGYFIETAMASARSALLRDYAVVLVPAAHGISALSRLDVDGGIVIDPLRDDPVLAQLRRRGLPVVTIGRDYTDGVRGPFVDRGAAGADIILEHLVHQGARRIAYLSGRQPRSLTLATRDYYQQWVAARNQPALVPMAEESDGEEGGRSAVAELLAAVPEVDAIYAPVDALAAGARDAVLAAGLTIPGDVMVATNYNGEQSRMGPVELTCLDLDLGGLAGRAVDLLIDLIEGRDVPERTTAAAPRLIPRVSTERPQPGR